MITLMYVYGVTEKTSNIFPLKVVLNMDDNFLW